MSYLRFYIEIQNAVETEWNEVAHFIDMIDLIRKGNDFENKFNYNHIKIYTKTAHQKDEYLFKKMLPINTKNEIKKDDIYGKRNKFKNYSFVDFVIILKITQKYLDFKKLIPFFFIHEQCENTSMGIDLNAITDFEARESLRFSLGQFFWKWRKFTRPHAENFLFYILDHEFTDRETGQLKKARKGAFPSKEDVVLKRYSPLIEINEVIFDEFFVNTLRKTLCKIKKLEDIDNFHFYNELIADHFKIDKEEPDMKSLFIRRYIDLKEKVKLSRYLSDVIYDKFKDEPFIAFYIFCMVLDRLLFERTNTKNKKEWQKEIEKLERSGDIITFISLVSKYVSGLREVVENIIFHTDKKKGYFYFVLKSPENYLKDFQEDIFHLINERRYKEAYFLLYKLNRKKLPNKFIEVFIADTSKKGIVDKYREQYNANEKRSLKKIKLEDFFVGGLSKFPDSSHLKWRYLAQLGLKTFANIVKDKYGYFDVSTHHKGNKQHFCYFKDIDTIPQYRKKWFSYLVSQNKIYGSHYNIILPISEELISDEEELRFTFEMESFIEILENWAWKKKSDSVPKIKYFDQFESYSVVQFKKKKEFIEIIGDKIASQLKNEKNSLLCIDFRILKQNSIDFSTFIKILAYIQLCKRFALIAVLNIDSNSFGQIRDELNILAQSRKFWSNYSVIYFYDENGVPFIISGESAKYCNALNRRVYLYYGSCHTLDDEFAFNNKYKPPLDKIDAGKINPYELLIKTKDKYGIPVTMFEKKVINILDSAIEKQSFGLKIGDTHMRLGSKIHLDNFFEAEVLFKDSYYVDRFAYLLARDILNQNQEKKRIILIGYGSYSEMLLNRTKYLLNFESRHLNREELCPEYVICDNVEDFKWINIENLKHLNPIEAYRFALIIPIGSTLTTSYKVIQSFENTVEKHLSIKGFTTSDKIIYNSTIIIVRDKVRASPSDQEKDYGWHIENKTIKVKYFKKEIKFSMFKEGGWRWPLTCEKCFPGAEKYPKNILNEIPLFETHKSSIIPKIVLNQPRVETDVNEFERGLEKIKDLSKFLKYGHIEKDNNHHLFYIDTKKFLDKKEDREKIAEWLRSIKSSIAKEEDAYDIIITVMHTTNMAFVNLANDIIFDGAANIIRLNLELDFRGNILTKYSYLKDIIKKEKINFHFIDNVILNGRILNIAKSFVSSIFEEETDNVEIFTSIVVLINRLSIYRKNDALIMRKKRTWDKGARSKSFFSAYIDLFVPPIRDSKIFCFLCKKQKDYLRLKEASVLDKLKFYFEQKANTLKVQRASDIETLAKSRYYNRLQFIHKIYFAVSNVPSLSPIQLKKVIDDFFIKCRSIEDKIDLIRVLASPFLSYYKIIKEIVFSKLLFEIDELLNKQVDRVEFLDFKLLVVLMTQLTELKSNFIIRKESMRRIWQFYSNYRQKFIKLENEPVKYTRISDLIQKMIELVVLKKEKDKIEKQWESGDEVNRLNKNILNTLEDKISRLEKKIYESGDIDYSFHEFEGCGELEELENKLYHMVKEIDSIDADTMQKTIYNILEFRYVYAALIKNLICDDETKSLWFEFLIRNGRELRDKDMPGPELTQLNTQIIFDFIAKDLPHEDKNLIKWLKDFIDIVFIENVTVYQNSIRNFILHLTDQVCDCQLGGSIEPKRCPLDNKFSIPMIASNQYAETKYKDITNELDKEIWGDQGKSIDGRYYYNNYRIMVNNIDSTAHKKLQRILMLKLILAANVCPNMDERLTGIELKDKMKKITGLMKQIVGADEAFFSIRKSIDKKASKEIFCIAATDRTDLPFVLNTHFFTRKVFYRKDSYTYYHKKLDRNFLEEIYFKNFNSIIVMRFFKPDTDIPAGAVTFMFKHEPLEIRENIKYLLLVEQDIKLFLRKHFFNDSFKSYINDRDLYDYTDILSHWFRSNIIARPELIRNRGYLERKLSEITNFLSNRKIQSFTNKTKIEVGVIWGVIEDYIGEMKKELTENQKERIKLSQNPLPDSRETFSFYIDKNYSALKHPLQNIINNSIDHNRDSWEKSHQHLEIKIEVIIEGNELEIAISDNGNGFKESEVREFNDMKPWIFTRKYTGIYIIKSLIYLCNGTVTFDNNDPKGSKITIRYPIYKEVKR